MGNYDKGNFILIEPMSRFPFQLLLTDTSADENVAPKLYNPLHKNQDNGKKIEDVKGLCVSEGSCAKKGLEFEKKALSSLSTCGVVLVPSVKAETQGHCCSAFKKHTGDLTHTQMHTRQNSLEQPELKAQASVQHVIMERRGLLKTPVKASGPNHSALPCAVLLIKLKPLHKTPI